MSSRWVLYGYKVYNDIFEIIPDEAEIVSRIFNEYMSGLSLKAIAEKLTSEQVIYKPGKSEWNKNMVSRILGNPHYAGDDSYPAIIDTDIYETVISRKNALGGKREKDAPEIKYLKSVIFCVTCGKQIHRLNKYSNDREKWLCDNNCKVAVYMDDNTLFDKIISTVNKVISQPDLLRIKTTIDSELDIDALRKTNEVRYMLDQPNIQFNPIKKALFDCTESRFNSFDFDETTYTEPLIKYIGQQTMIDKIDVQLLSTVVSRIYINCDGILAMVDSNLQRERILPSEKAKAYKMRMEALQRQGKRTDLTLSPVATKLPIDSAKELGEQVGESRDQIFRYIRLNDLIPEILQLVDEDKIAMRPAVEISYLPEESQKQLYESMGVNDCTPSHDQTIRMKKAFKEGTLTNDMIEDIMCEEKPNQREKSPFRDSRISQLIPKSVPLDKQCDYVLKALQFYNKYLQKKREQAR